MNFLAIFLFLFVSSSALAALPSLPTLHLERIKSDKPLYEFGLVGGAGFVPHYPAADQGRMRYIAAPIVRYRGLRFRSDEEDSMKARLFSNPMYGIDLSVGGSFSANSNDNDARKGMPDLNYTGELGPRLYFYLIKTNKMWFRLFLPVRVAFSSDLREFTYQGLVFAPAMNLRFFFDDSKFNSIFMGVSRTHTTHQLQEFFYEVKDRFATPQRNAYKAVGGYMSSNGSIAFLHEKNNKGFYAGIGLNSFQGAANAGSPLHKADFNYSAFVGFTYTFFKSEERGYQ